MAGFFTYTFLAIRADCVPKILAREEGYRMLKLGTVQKIGDGEEFTWEEDADAFLTPSLRKALIDFAEASGINAHSYELYRVGITTIEIRDADLASEDQKRRKLSTFPLTGLQGAYLGCEVDSVQDICWGIKADLQFLSKAPAAMYSP